MGEAYSRNEKGNKCIKSLDGKPKIKRQSEKLGYTGG